MRPMAIIIALAGLVGASASLLGYRAAMIKDEIPGKSAIVEAQETAVEDREPVSVALPVPARVRPVAPAEVALPPVAQDVLERIEEREPLSPIGRAHVPSEGPPKPTVLHRPLVIAAGTFQSLGHVVTLAGVDPVRPDEKCVSDGTTWPCGVHARTAFRNWLRGRAPNCVVPPVASPEVVVTDCTLGKLNPAEWLVSFGWARALAGGPYVEQEKSARDQRRGIYGPAPVAAEAMTITVPEVTGGEVPEPILVGPEPGLGSPSGG